MKKYYITPELVEYTVSSEPIMVVRSLEVTSSATAVTIQEQANNGIGLSEADPFEFSWD